MNVLGLDTCFPALGVAVGAGLGVAAARSASRTEPMLTGHAERMMPLIAELLAKLGLTISDIDRIAVTNGPGSFTGTRIGVAAARAFQLARDIPVVPFSSLEAIALSPQIVAGSGEDLIVAVDAHRGEAYVQTFDGATREPLTAPQLFALSDLAGMARSYPLVVVGTAAQAVAAAVEAQGGKVRAHPGMIFPDMAAAIVRAVAREPAIHPVEPLYLRPPDAKPQDGKSLERAGA